MHVLLITLKLTGLAPERQCAAFNSVRTTPVINWGFVQFTLRFIVQVGFQNEHLQADQRPENHWPPIGWLEIKAQIKSSSFGSN